MNGVIKVLRDPTDTGGCDTPARYAPRVLVVMDILKSLAQSATPVSTANTNINANCARRRRKHLDLELREAPVTDLLHFLADAV